MSSEDEEGKEWVEVKRKKKEGEESKSYLFSAVSSKKCADKRGKRKMGQVNESSGYLIFYPVLL